MKAPQKSLKDWGDQKWLTKSGKPSSKTGERYLPEAAIKSLSPATKNKGGLHRSLGIPIGTKIPAAKLTAAISKGGKVGKQARLAKTLKSFKS